MKTKETTKQSYGIDPHAFLGPRDPRILPDFTKAERIALTDIVLEYQHEHALTRRHPATGKLLPDGHRLWSAIRTRDLDPHTTVDRALQRPAIQSPVMALEKLITLLLDLRGQRQELEQKLRQLDAIEAAFASESELVGK